MVTPTPTVVGVTVPEDASTGIPMTGPLSDKDGTCITISDCVGDECCSKFGFCGIGDAYCGDNATTTTTAPPVVATTTLSPVTSTAATTTTLPPGIADIMSKTTATTTEEDLIPYTIAPASSYPTFLPTTSTGVAVGNIKSLVKRAIDNSNNGSAGSGGSWFQSGKAYDIEMAEYDRSSFNVHVWHMVM